MTWRDQRLVPDDDLVQFGVLALLVAVLAGPTIRGGDRERDDAAAELRGANFGSWPRFPSRELRFREPAIVVSFSDFITGAASAVAFRVPRVRPASAGFGAGVRGRRGLSAPQGAVSICGYR